MKKHTHPLPVTSLRFFAACFLLFLVSQFYLVLQVSSLMKSAGSVFLLSSVLMAMTIPRVIILPISGFLIDKFGAFKILRLGSAALCALLSFYFVFNRQNLIQVKTIFIFAILFGGSSALITPALYAAIPAVTTANRLQQANSILQFINQAAMLSGPMLAEIADHRAENHTWLLMAGASLAALSLIAGIKNSENRAQAVIPEAVREPRRKPFAELFKLPILVLLLIFTAILNLCIIGPQQIGFPILAESCLPDGIDGYPTLLSMNGAGSLIGAVLIGAVKKMEKPRVIRRIAWISLLSGAIWGLLGLIHNHAAILGAVFCAGLLFGIINVLFLTAIQQITPDFLIGRVMSIQFLCSVGLQPVSYLATGLSLDRLSLTGVYLISGGGIAVTAAVMLLYTEKDRMNFTRRAIHAEDIAREKKSTSGDDSGGGVQAVFKKRILSDVDGRYNERSGRQQRTDLHVFQKQRRNIL